MWPDGQPIWILEMLRGAGVMFEEEHDDMSEQFAAIQGQIDLIRTDMQRQIDQLREEVLGVAAPQAGAQPGRPVRPGQR
jgi:lipase chaperone LimK